MAEGPLGYVRASIVLMTCAFAASATAQPDPCSRIRDAATAKTAYDAALAAAVAPVGTRPGATVSEADAAVAAAEAKVQTYATESPRPSSVLPRTAA
ncbi:MAG: hypothetical protein IV100_20045 [Myxococcales bacterium]|nr:hypothetical protein [Myxococcales bacterium]